MMKIGTILRPSIDADELNRYVKEDFEADSMDKVQLMPGDSEEVKA